MMCVRPAIKRLRTAMIPRRGEGFVSQTSGWELLSTGDLSKLWWAKTTTAAVTMQYSQWQDGIEMPEATRRS